MFESIAEMEDLPDELLGTPFEKLVFFVLKNMANTIRNLEDRIEKLEQGGK